MWDFYNFCPAEICQKEKAVFTEVIMVLETERLYFREMNQLDFNSLCKILQDEDTMYAYEGAFSDKEVQ